MFELEQYELNGYFFLNFNDNMLKVCNAPKEGVGVYVVYALKDGEIDLVYIGSAGIIRQDGAILYKIGSLYHSLVYDNQFGKPGEVSWKEKMKKENIETLNFYWFVTMDEDHYDIPSVAAGITMQKYLNLYGNLPRWNVEV